MLQALPTTRCCYATHWTVLYLYHLPDKLKIRRLMASQSNTGSITYSPYSPTSTILTLSRTKATTAKVHSDNHHIIIIIIIATLIIYQNFTLPHQGKNYKLQALLTTCCCYATQRTVLYLYHLTDWFSSAHWVLSFNSQYFSSNFNAAWLLATHLHMVSFYAIKHHDIYRML